MTAGVCLSDSKLTNFNYISVNVDNGPTDR